MIKQVLCIVLLYGICCACSSEKLTEREIQIINDKFNNQLIQLWASLEPQEAHKALASAIDLIIKDVHTNNQLTTSRDTIIQYAAVIISDVASEWTPDTYLKSLNKAAIADFSRNKMSRIEEYEFVENILEAYYWKNWGCNLRTSFTINTYAMDTILLYEQSEYYIPIAFERDEQYQNPFRLRSNSLQKGRPNELYIKTGKAATDIQKKIFEMKAYNIFTEERLTVTDSILYKVVQR